jgi:hypothetical protein
MPVDGHLRYRFSVFLHDMHGIFFILLLVMLIKYVWVWSDTRPVVYHKAFFLCLVFYFLYTMAFDYVFCCFYGYEWNVLKQKHGSGNQVVINCCANFQSRFFYIFSAFYEWRECFGS